MIYIDEDKLRLGTLRMIGEDCGISENKYNMCNEEGYDAYIDELLSILYNQTEEELDYIVECCKEDWLEELKQEGRLKED